MRSNFKPVRLKKANEVLSKHLRAAEAYVNTNKVYKQEVFKRPTLWEKFRALVKK